MNGIYWLASFPKSGNTWTRTFLKNYLNAGETAADINALDKDMACDRRSFDALLGLDSADLDEEQIKLYQPYMYEELVKNSSTDLYIKIHDAYTLNKNNIPLIPQGVTKGAVYILRNPLDVCVSYAHHAVIPVDKAMACLCSDTFTVSRSKYELKLQLPQIYRSWSGHVNSWMESPLRVHLMRYEDMIADPGSTFKAMLEFMHFEVDAERLEKAVRFSSFDSLKKQEQEKGFVEKFYQTEAFFRKGKIGSYRDEMSREQIDAIVESHRETMIKYGYLDEQNQLIY